MNARLHHWLSLKWLWLASTISFRWAHKPLCDRFAHDVLRVGDVAICRSCTCLYAGFVSGMVACRFLPEKNGMVLLACGVALLLAVALSCPKWYGSWSRRFRDVLRFGCGWLATICAILSFQQHLALGGLLLMTLWMCRHWYLQLRGARKQVACQGCPEFGTGEICSGFTHQARRLRKYEELATRMLYEQVALPTDKDFPLDVKRTPPEKVSG